MKSHKQLIYEQRCQIHALKKTGISQTAMAKIVGLSQPTISRELKRNMSIPISLFIAKEVLTETASGLEMEKFRESLKQKIDWGWGQYAEGLVDIHIVPGDHHTMMRQPYVKVLAEKLETCL